MGSILLLVAGDFLLYAGTMLGFTCPGCGLRDPGVWLYTILPWIAGLAFLVIAGLLYRRTALPMRDVLRSIGLSVGLGIGLMLALFVLLAIMAGAKQN